MSRILLLTPDPNFAAHHREWLLAEPPLRAALEGGGHQVDFHQWTDADIPTGFSLVLPLLAWGYHVAYNTWLERAGAWNKLGLNVLNPPAVLAWNADKRYLKTLEAKGVRCIPTCFVDRLCSEDLTAAAETFVVDRLVIKPVLGGGAYKTLRVRPGDDLNAGPDGPALIQPYLPSIETEGELSLLFFDGEFSHAVVKRPVNGDFRVQTDFGGLVIPVQPPEDALELARITLAAVGEPLLYARVDVVRDLQNQPALIELEVIEPELFLPYAPDGGRLFLSAISTALER